MRGFLSHDGVITRGINKLVDMVMLAILWLVSCIPLITVGAASTALYYTVQKVIKYDCGKIGAEYWRSFRMNFKQATVVWLILLVIYYLFGVSLYSTWLLCSAGLTDKWTILMTAIPAILVTMWAVYLFPSIARFHNKTKTIMINCLTIAVMHLGASLLLFLLVAAAIVAVVTVPASVILVPVAYMYFSGFILEGVFRRYMSQEELEMEATMNTVISD